MSTELDEKIPNNVNLAGDKRLQRALEQWLPNYLSWWQEVGPEGFQADDIDFADEVRVAVEERASLSPDALTGMEQNLRYAGPESPETKIFGRLSAWQNWIFQRPNAVGDRGALTLYGRPESPEFDWRRT